MLVCHPILFSFVSWRAGGRWGGGETRIPRLNSQPSVQQEERRKEGQLKRGWWVQRGGKGFREGKEEVKAKGAVFKFSRSIHRVQMRRREGSCEKRLYFS
jgi:hypothetical protein